jgi:hypothetical protein
VSTGKDTHEIIACRQLIRKVVLVEVEDQLTFATPLHKRFYSHLVYPSQITHLPARCRSIDNWLLLVIQTLEPDKLKHPMSQGFQGFTKEGPVQHAFWRGASFCLPPEYQLAAEVSRLIVNGKLEAKLEGRVKGMFFGLFCWKTCSLIYLQVNLISG